MTSTTPASHPDPARGADGALGATPASRPYSTPGADPAAGAAPGADAAAALDIDGVIARLSLDDKARLCAGADTWRTAAVPELGIPALKLSDGPTGVRGATFTSARSTSFPCGTAVGATFDPALAARLGRALAAEARAKGASVVLGPTVNLHRTPLAGRNFECYAEDPHLTAVQAVAFIEALQGGGVAACVKHFVCNDAEFERMTMSSDVDPRPLRELYLRPFEAAVRAGVWTLMTAYNRVNGTSASEHVELVADLLKGEWGFDGLVMSDWTGTYSTTPAALAGLDLEMPGPPVHFGAALADAVRSGAVDEKVLDDKVRRLLRLVERTGGLDRAPAGPEPGTITPEHRALARDLAADSFVLLRNEVPAGADAPLLPLDAAALTTVAVLGPNAVDPAAMGGGSSRVHTDPIAGPTEALTAALAGRAEVVVEAGAGNGRRSVPLGGRLVEGPVRLSYHPLGRPEAPALATEELGELTLLWFGDAPAGVPSSFTVVARARVVADLPDGATAALFSAGAATLDIDGAEVAATRSTGEEASPLDRMGRTDPVALPAGGPEVVVRYDHAGTDLIGGVSLTVRLPDDPGRLDRAVAAARRADTAVVVVGTHDRWETEGSDRTTLALPGDQDELVRAVAAANPRTVVVVNAGAPVAMPWADDVAAVLVTWFPGLEGGPALADVLLGDREPGGRLPVTFPRRIEDTPTWTTDPGEAGHLRYGEGLFTGYRWYDRRDIAPAFPFGAGLGYTTFRYDGATAVPAEDPAGPPAAVRVTVTNTGDRRGSEVVQAYVRRPGGDLVQPLRVLAGFAKVAVDAGATVTVDVPLAAEAVRSWRPGRGWTVPPGRYGVDVGPSSRDLPLAIEVDVAVDIEVAGAGAGS